MINVTETYTWPINVSQITFKKINLINIRVDSDLSNTSGILIFTLPKDFLTSKCLSSVLTNFKVRTHKLVLNFFLWGSFLDPI